MKKYRRKEKSNEDGDIGEIAVFVYVPDSRYWEPIDCKCICHEKDFKLGHDTQCCENMNGYTEEPLKDWEEIKSLFYMHIKENGDHAYTTTDFFKPHFLSLQHRIKELEKECDFWKHQFAKGEKKIT